MTEERLYYTDSYLAAFEAVVRESERKGDRWEVVLDRTAFYPTSGGQPHDTGTLDAARVLEVFEDEDGNVRHVLDRELEQDARVRGSIDWGRRFDHMQQHTGQHLLSAAFERETSAKTLSFHLGTHSSTLDLDRDLPADALARVEDAANGIVWEDRDVSARLVSAAEAATLPLRKDPARAGELRLIEIADYDLSACGGTHVCRTGAIGMIALAASERFKGGLRVEFLCGRRALQAFRQLKQAVDGSVRALSVLPRDLPAAIEKIQAASREQQKMFEGLQERLAAHEAAALGAKAQKAGSVSLVAGQLAGWDAAGLKRVASGVVAGAAATAAVLLSAESPAAIVVARSADLQFDAGDVLKKLLGEFGGKGGGRGSMAQGGGLTAPAPAVLERARQIVSELA